MTTPNEKNLASGTIAESISASSTTILVYVGEGGATTIKGVWPTTPFYATIMPSNPNAGVANSLDSEIVLVTAVGNDQVGNTALTVTRGQRGTTTKAYVEGDIVTAGIYAEDAVLLGDDGTAENPSPWIDNTDIKPTAFAMPVYLGKVNFTKRTYSNSRMYLEGKTDFYTATGVSSEIKNTYYLYIYLPATGSYVVRMRSSLWTNGNSWDYMMFSNEKNSSTISRAMAPKISGSWGFVETEGMTTIENGDYLSCYLNTNNNNFSDGNMSGTDSYMLVEVYKVG